jgi:hypothetical protein
VAENLAIRENFPSPPPPSKAKEEIIFVEFPGFWPGIWIISARIWAFDWGESDSIGLKSLNSARWSLV